MNAESKVVWSFMALLAGCGLIAQGIRSTSAPGGSEQRFRNLSDAVVIEIHDGVSQRVLRGEFRAQASVSGSVIRAATLAGENDNAVGTAEIELSRHPSGALVQELEVDVDGLTSNASFDVLIDGQRVGAFDTDPRGAAELERFGRVAEARVKAAD